MESNVERECTILGGIFQQIINDMKNGTPLWEDLISKATKLQACLRATIQAIAAFLDAFQKIADAATNTRGATKEIGTALTRICLRHRAVEAKMKTFTSAITECLVAPLQEKLEDWKKTVVNIDKEHAKDYKKARSELKKRSTDTLRLQKKARKSGRADDLQKALLEVSEKKSVLEETEKKAVREALIEERSRYCLFVTFLKPVVDEEISMLSELSHLEEAMDQLEKHTSDPYSLPPASEQVLTDLKCTDASWTFQSPPPSSPSSIGSRKSSMCSISSLNSSSSGSSKSHHSPNHMYWNRSSSQRYHPPQLNGTHRLCSVSSQDSGFTSQDTLCIRNSTASFFQQQVSDMMEENIGSSTESATSLAAPTATWPNLQDTLQFEKAASAILNDRPHTISSAYEKGHQRPALSVYTFQMPDSCHSQPCSPSGVSSCGDTTPVVSPQAVYATAVSDCSSTTAMAATGVASSTPIYARPPLPQRGSSLERPSVPGKLSNANCDGNARDYHYRNSGDRITQPTYVNMYELATMAASKAQEHFPPPPPEDCVPNENSFHNEKHENVEKESSASESSLESSSGYGSQSGMSGATPTPEFDNGHHEGYCTIKSGTLSRRGSVQTPKPPPPVRRTSSILNTSRPNISRNSNNGSMENLPPPPAFLLENTSNIQTCEPDKKNVANSIAAELQKRNITMSTFTDQLKSATAQRIYATPMDHHRRSITTIYAASTNVNMNTMSTCMSPKIGSTSDLSADKSDKQIEIEKHSGISVAETVRTLTEMNHQPASPVSVRRTSSIRSTSADRRPESNLIAALSARITPTLSPRNSRKHYQEPAKMMTVPRANRVRQWIASRTVPDPTLCRASLMDQIKKGAHLRPTGMINDRSAPKTN
ncbi:protein MTSS 2 isoform X2 [Planococcus citri]|uniref:protein MTSS 2 isoform X2 n=1 Tax=Planococcus citri TaxID=170843 RepID=UPI0031F78485